MNSRRSLPHSCETVVFCPSLVEDVWRHSFPVIRYAQNKILTISKLYLQLVCTGMLASIPNCLAADSIDLISDNRMKFSDSFHRENQLDRRAQRCFLRSRLQG